MDGTQEPSAMRASQIQPPSRIPAKVLADSSDSHINSRSIQAFQSRMLPPSSLKRGLGASVNEPEPKRKTLAERAGESYSSAPATKAPRSQLQGTSFVGAISLSSSTALTRVPSNSSSWSTTSRTTSNSSRITSNGSSFASSVGPASRPQSGYGVRSKAVAHSKSTTSRPTSSLLRGRPATSSGYRSEDEEHNRKQDGTVSYSSVQSSISSRQRDWELHAQKRGGSSSPMASSVSSPKSQRTFIADVMLPAFHKLKLDGKGVRSNLSSRRSSIISGLEYTSTDSNSNALIPYVPPKSKVAQESPSRLPKPQPRTIMAAPTTPRKTPRSSPKKGLRKSPSKAGYLRKHSNAPALAGFNIDQRLGAMQGELGEMTDTFKESLRERSGMLEAIDAHKARYADLEARHSELFVSNQTLQNNLDEMRQKADSLQQQLLMTTNKLHDQIRIGQTEADDKRRDHQQEIDRLQIKHDDDINRLISYNELALKELERRIQYEQQKHNLKVQSLEADITNGNRNLALESQQKDHELQKIQAELEDLKTKLDREQTLKVEAQKNVADLQQSLQKTAIETSTTIQTYECTVASLRARITFLESGSQAQSDSFAEMEARLQDAQKSAELYKQKLITEETLRRILFNQYQDLKGNIRVMCRVRPANTQTEGAPAQLTYPDADAESKELIILGREEKSSLGTITRKTYPFTCDHVFGPSSQNEEVFAEISPFVQSVTDGYNGTIFCYGQTGSGKTHTMSSADGMIPRATKLIYETVTNLKEKGWVYIIEGSFVEVYNEELHDLLGNGEKKKHEIRHDDQKKQTTVTNLKIVPLDSASTVESMLKLANTNRSVAATKSNERSSRSHSVFMLKLTGRNSITNQVSESTLNLVDLAGSERLKSSGAEGERMKETQNINKSLSCLGDVIAALGQGKEGGHIPYRNSKLTYLLQYSLGGNSKTLMFVMASPLEAHLTETLTSLKFATKVYNTHIGAAKKTTKVRND